MAAIKKAHHLSIFLVKNAPTSVDEIVEADSCDPALQIPISGIGSAHLFIKRTPPAPPKWMDLFKGSVDTSLFKLSGLSAVLVLEVNERWFVLAFGQGGHALIKSDVCEERFGLLCALNCVDPKSFRCVDLQSLDAIQSHTRIQSGEEATRDQFGLDIEQDMLKAIVGAPLNVALGTRMTGTDSLSVNVKLDLTDLGFLLDEYRKQFETNLSDKDHEWVNNIAPVKDPSIVETLQGILLSKLASAPGKDVWMAIPGIIDWSTVKGFMFTGGRREVHPDINLKAFLKTVDPSAITIELLHRRRVQCADADHNPVHKHWPVYKCLSAEIDHGGRKYILNDGKWFSVALDFVDKTNGDFAKIPASALSLPPYKGGGEGFYNASVAASEPTKFALLDDTKKVMHGGGHGQVEICDLFSATGELIHVKHYGKSSVFSHLFSQGFVSAQLIQIDNDFRRKVREKLQSPFLDLIEEDTKPMQDSLTVVYAVISEEPGADLSLPFFSRVNLNNTSKVLRGYGYRVQLLKIPVDEQFAKTTKLPPSKKVKPKAFAHALG